MTGEHCCVDALAVQREANQLVEEFMLLANMSVAALIARAFPGRALLRRHPPPHQRKMEELAATAAGLVSHALTNSLSFVLLFLPTLCLTGF